LQEVIRSVEEIPPLRKPLPLLSIEFDVRRQTKDDDGEDDTFFAAAVAMAAAAAAAF